MTGYGSAEGGTGLGQVSVESRSVNHRFCDMSINISRKLAPLEGRIKELVKSRFARGRIDVFVKLHPADGAPDRLGADLNMARQYVNALQSLKSELNLKGEIRLDMVAQARDIIVPMENEERVEEHWQEIGRIVERSLDALKKMRSLEGAGLAQDLKQRIASVRSFLEMIKGRAPEVVADYRKKLGHRMEKIMQGVEVDPVRLIQEIALFAEKSDISEETVRMESHLDQLEQMIHSPEPVGRKLEFLLQEVHREANTISSKANDQTISQTVVEIKAELEKMREQAQNIE